MTLAEQIKQVNALYDAVGYNSKDFSPCSEIRFLQMSEDMLAIIRQLTVIGAEKDAEIAKWYSLACKRLDDCDAQAKEISRLQRVVDALNTAWVNYKSDMRPETRNQYLRVSSSMFDTATQQPICDNANLHFNEVKLEG